MILKFSFSNVFSFKDEQVVSFEPDPLKELNEHLIVPKSYGKSERFLRALAIYGHNSHGKSNFLKVFELFVSITKNSFRTSTALDSIESFALNTSSIGKPSYFEIVLTVENVKYRYAFEATSKRIVSEWLYYAPYGVKESNLFTRAEQEFRISKQWNKECDLKIESQAVPFAVPNVLLLSVLIAQQNETIVNIAQAISSIIVLKDLGSDRLLGTAATIFANKTYASKVQSFIDDADLGFKTIFNKIEKKLSASNQYEEGFLKEIVYERNIEKFELFSFHTIYDALHNEKAIVEFDFIKKESEGTIKFFILTTLLVLAIKNGYFLIIDELDSKFHSDLLSLIIRKFHSKEINNSEAQLIFTSHNTILLDEDLRRDQVLLVEKNIYGESKIQPMHTKKTPVRFDTSIEKAYRKGKFGGVSKKLRKNPNDPNQRSLFD
ncbi:MAG: ATP-binding protein [Ferruginibacter sp.]